MKTLDSKLSKQKNILHTKYPWVYLFIVQITSTEAVYLTNHSEQIAYNSHKYNPFPVILSDAVESSKGNLESVTLTVSNTNRMMMAYMELHDALLNNEVQIYLVSRIDTSVAIDLGLYTITEAAANEDVATFVLGHYDFFSLKFPRNRFLRNRCHWVYKSTQCGYAGGIGDCDKTLDGTNGCRVHVNEDRFGGFPGIPVGQLVVR